MTEQTLSIIKPNAVLANQIGEILSRIERANFKITAIKMVHLTNEQAGGFYAEHKGKPFFDGLVAFMTSAPIVVLVLEKENAVEEYRALMGATDPKNAAPGTLRADFAVNMRQNAVHGSDSVDSAEREIAYFFSESEIFS